MNPKFLADNLSEVIDQYPFYKKIEKGQLIFIHIPKTGGTSINVAIDFPHPNLEIDIKKHYRLCKIKPAIDPQLWKTSFKFCFVRNPWDRLYSHYRFRSRQKLLKAESHYDSFKEWLIFELRVNPKKGNLRPQLEWIQDDEGNIDLDFIGRFERFSEDFNHFCERNELKVELSHVEKSFPPVNYQDYYDQEMIDIAAEYYKDDIQYFDYSY